MLIRRGLRELGIGIWFGMVFGLVVGALIDGTVNLAG